VVIPNTNFPRSRLYPEIQKAFRKYSLKSFQSVNYPPNEPLIFDLSYYLKAIDNSLKPGNYRQRGGLFIKNILLKTFSMFPSNYTKVFLYSINVNNEFPEYINRKFYPILEMLKNEEVFFDDLLFCILKDKPNYRLLVKEREYNLQRIIPYLRSLKYEETDLEEEKDEEIKDASEKVLNTVRKDEIPIQNTDKLKNIVKDYLKSNKKEVEKIFNKPDDKNIQKKIAVSSILQKINNNPLETKKIVKNIPIKRLNKAVHVIDKTYTDKILMREKTVSNSKDLVTKETNIPMLVDNKSPKHIFEKRKIDFEKNLKTDMINSFKVLERKEIPLKIEHLEIQDKPQRPGEVEKSDISIIKTILRDQLNNEHLIEMEIPRIDPNTGAFRINGRKKCLINQIVQDPITFPKPYDSKFESSYSSFHISSRRLKAGNYLEIYMASYKLPLLVLLSFSFGFENTLKRYGIEYEFVNAKTKKDLFITKISEDKFILFKNVDNELKKELVSSLIRADLSSLKINKPFPSKEFFNLVIIKLSGRINSTFLIQSNLENIVDPIVKEVLIDKQQPFILEDIIQYMTENVIKGTVIDRNDISNQRIRNSEIIVHLAQKQILMTYTQYKEQVLSGNKNAKFLLSPTKVLSEFLNSEIVTDMEYANPIEEMSTMTRVSPVGKKVGGIPDKMVVQVEARNIHPSYFGNIDPLDTPEGSNIGVVQHLTIDSQLTTTRGLFALKEINNEERSGILSTTAVMIPFVENNEGARIIMSVNQARQALPLKNPEPPIIQTGYESILSGVLSDNFVKKSPCNGKVEKVNKDEIHLRCEKGERKIISTIPVHLRSGSGKNTLSVFNHTVKSGDNVKKDEIISEGSCISKGSIALGRTLATCYMSYKGYNFEDGLVISEDLVESQKMVSLHGIIEDIFMSENDRLLYLAEIGSYIKKGDPIIRKTVGEIEQLIGFDNIDDDDSSLISSGQYIKKSPGGRIVDIEVLSNLPSSKFQKLNELIQRTNQRYGKPDKQNFTIKGNPFKGLIIRFKIEQELNINIGDKLCGRFGNKGIVSLVEKRENMPRTPWGERVEIIMNPIGVISRMNIGQMYEMYCGLISKKLSQVIIENPKRINVLNIFDKTLSLLDNTKNKKYTVDFINRIKNLSDQNYNLLIEQIKKESFVPIIVPPFKSPNKEQITKALKSLGLQDSYYLTLPEYGTKTIKPVPFGYSYIYKLEHIGEMKVHVRSTGPVAGKTLQPLAGKKKEGGQRVGEGDTWALLSYNCPTILSELFGPLSDDHAMKNEMVSDIIQTGQTKWKESKTSPTKDILNSYFISLMLSK